MSDYLIKFMTKSRGIAAVLKAKNFNDWLVLTVMLTSIVLKREMANTHNLSTTPVSSLMLTQQVS